MSAPSHHTINVTHLVNHKEVHWFRIDTDNQSEEEIKVITFYLRCMPEAETVTVTYWSCSGERTSL